MGGRRDVAVLEVGGRHWIQPAPASGSGPVARAFHAAAAFGRVLYVFGGHVYIHEKAGLHKFDDAWALDTVRLGPGVQLDGHDRDELAELCGS